MHSPPSSPRRAGLLRGGVDTTLPRPGSDSSLRGLLDTAVRPLSQESEQPDDSQHPVHITLSSVPIGASRPQVEVTGPEADPFADPPAHSVQAALNSPSTPLATTPQHPALLEQQLIAIRDQAERELAELRTPSDPNRATDSDLPPRYSPSWLAE
jgi:hypothetical protein